MEPQHLKSFTVFSDLRNVIINAIALTPPLNERRIRNAQNLINAAVFNVVNVVVGSQVVQLLSMHNLKFHPGAKLRISEQDCHYE